MKTPVAFKAPGNARLPPAKRILHAALPSLLLVCLALSSCAAGQNELIATARSGETEPAGFLLGLWHGIIALVAFIVSLFNKNVNVYEVHNAGATYNLGFILGLMLSFGGTAKGSGCGKPKK